MVEAAAEIYDIASVYNKDTVVDSIDPYHCVPYLPAGNVDEGSCVRCRIQRLCHAVA
jgi:hypothetical protein